MKNVNYDYKNLTPFKWFCLTNFPFIEYDFDALTNYELMCKIVQYLNEVIVKTNEIGEQTENLTTSFINLKNYVDNYFENLDVQEEINNKLDDMVESGELAEIISQYLNSTAIFGFDNVASMKSATNLVNGSYAKTLGYYAKNDGGEATYKIRTVTNDDVIDEMFIIEIGDTQNELVAELILEDDKLYANKLGIKNDGSVDVSTKLNNVMQKLNQYWLDKNDINTLVLEGTYLIENKVTIPPCVKLRNSGFVEIKSSVVNDSTFLIDYLSNDLPTNRFNKQQYLYGAIIDFDKGCKIVSTRDKTTDNTVAIEVGSRTNRGVDYPISRYNIRNVSITNFTIGILHNSYNVYISRYENIFLELNITNIQFGLYSQIGTASNQGERMSFENCIIGPSTNGVYFGGVGWITYWNNCSFDFCVNCFKQETRDQNYWNKIQVTSSHFEGFTKLGVNIGNNEEIFNINNSEIYNSIGVQNLFDNCICDKFICNTLLHFKFNQNDLNPEHYVSLDENVFLNNTLSSRSTESNQYFIKNNMVKSFDSIEDGNISIEDNDYVGEFKVAGARNLNRTAQIVTDNYLYTGHKSLLLTRTATDTAVLNLETDLKPLTNQTKIFSGLFLYNLKTSRTFRAMVEFYDENDNLVKQKSAYEWAPSDPQENTWSINPYGFFDNVPSNATQYKIKVYIPNFGAGAIGTQYKLGGIIVNSR